MSSKKLPVSSRAKEQVKPDQDTRYEGYLMLREKDKHRKRYFVLSGPSLYCFKSTSDTEPKAIYYLTDWQVSSVEGTKLKHVIHLVRERPITEVEELLASSAEDKTSWMQNLMKEKSKIIAARAPRLIQPTVEDSQQPNVSNTSMHHAVKQVIEEDSERTFITGKTTQIRTSATVISSTSNTAIDQTALGIHAMLPTIIRCLQHLHRIGAEVTPQIFAVPGDINELVRLKEEAASFKLDLSIAKDPLCVAQLVRLQLDSNLHEPLLKWDYARSLADLTSYPTPLHRIDRIKAIFQTLPQDEQGVFRELILFLHKVDKNYAQSRMSAAALAALFFKRISCSREVSLSLISPEELERERQVYIDMVTVIIKRANRLFTTSAANTTSSVRLDANLDTESSSSSFARQIGSDGLLFLMKQEVNDLNLKFNALSVGCSDWGQLDAATNQMRKDLKELKAHEAQIHLQFENDFDEIDSMIDNVKPHYLSYPEKPPPSKLKAVSPNDRLPSSLPGKSSGLYSSWVAQPRKK